MMLLKLSKGLATIEQPRRLAFAAQARPVFELRFEVHTEPSRCQTGPASLGTKLTALQSGSSFAQKPRSTCEVRNLWKGREPALWPHHLHPHRERVVRVFRPGLSWSRLTIRPQTLPASIASAHPSMRDIFLTVVALRAYIFLFRRLISDARSILFLSVSASEPSAPCIFVFEIMF